MKVVILAAGKGSRFGSEYNKCSLKINEDEATYSSSVGRLINQISRKNNTAEFYVVVGYNPRSVIQSIALEVEEPSRINYIYNPSFNQYGCNYSLSLTSHLFNGSDSVMIVEADNVFGDHVISEVLDVEETNPLYSYCLVRDKKYITKSSVVVTMKETRPDCVSNLLYDQSHKSLFCLPDSFNPKDSMQVFVVGKYKSEFFGRLLKDYRSYVIKRKVSGKESGIYSLSSLIETINNEPDNCFKYVESSCPDQWININTKKDLEKVKRMIAEGEI